MFWELNLRPKRQLLNRNFGSYHVGYHFCGALTIKMSWTTCWNEKPYTFIASEKKSLESSKLRFKRSRSDLSAKSVLIDKDNVLEFRMMFWGLILRLKGQLVNRNFGSYHVLYHDCGALTIEINGTTCWNEKPKTFFASKKKSLESSKSRFKRSRNALSAKKLSKPITLTF